MFLNFGEELLNDRSTRGLNRFSVSPLMGASALSVQKTGKKETIILTSRTKGRRRK